HFTLSALVWLLAVMVHVSSHNFSDPLLIGNSSLGFLIITHDQSVYSVPSSAVNIRQNQVDLTHVEPVSLQSKWPDLYAVLQHTGPIQQAIILTDEFEDEHLLVVTEQKSPSGRIAIAFDLFNKRTQVFHSATFGNGTLLS